VQHGGMPNVDGLDALDPVLKIMRRGTEGEGEGVCAAQEPGEAAACALLPGRREDYRELQRRSVSKTDRMGRVGRVFKELRWGNEDKDERVCQFQVMTE
jgi:hypothetical protein